MGNNAGEVINVSPRVPECVWLRGVINFRGEDADVLVGYRRVDQLRKQLRVHGDVVVQQERPVAVPVKRVPHPDVVSLHHSQVFPVFNHLDRREVRTDRVLAAIG